MECVTVCPAENALYMGLPQLGAKKAMSIPGWAMAAGVAVLFLGIVGFAKVTGHWQSAISNSAYQVLVPHADEAGHPMPGR